MEQLLSHMINLKELVTVGRVPSFMIDEFCKLEKLESLSLLHPPESHLFELFFKLSGIKSLSLTCFQRNFDDSFDMDWKLERFQFCGSPMTDKAWNSFLDNESFKNLQYLRANYLPNEESIVEKISTLESLTQLEIVQKGFGGDKFKHISKLSKLKKLSAPGSKNCSKGLKYISNLTNLESLDLSGSYIQSSGLSKIGMLKKLEEIELSNIIDSKEAQYLSSFPNLTTLILSNNHIKDEGLENFGLLKSLTYLNLNLNNIQNGLKYLSECKLLKILDVGMNDLQDESLLEFIDLNLKIEKLNLSQNVNLSEKSFQNISKMSELSELDISNNPQLGDLILSHLSSLKLSKLEANKCEISDSGLLKYLEEYSIRYPTNQLFLSIESNNFSNISLNGLIKHTSIIRQLQISESPNFDIETVQKLRENIKSMIMSSRAFEIENHLERDSNNKSNCSVE